MVQVVRLPGRKRKSTASRYPNGRIREERPPSPAVIAARMPHRAGVDQSDCVSHMAESELGRIFLSGRPVKLSKGQYDAGVRFAGVVARYRATISGPRPVLVGGRGYDCPGLLDCDDCECRRRKAAYDEAFEALAQAGQQAAKAVRLVVIQDERCPYSLSTPLAWGLAALSRYFDVAEDTGARPMRVWEAS